VIRAVVSDFGGVLTSPLMEAFARVQDGIGVPPEAYAAAMRHNLEHYGEHPLHQLERGEISEREFLARVERGFAGTLGREVSLHGFGTRLMDELHPNHELFEYYRGLRERGLQFALCTNNVREWEPLWRPKLPIDEVFEVVVDSAFVGTRKPEPEIYAITLDRLALPGEACAFVDDVSVNVTGAEAAGMHGVHFENTAQTIAMLDRLVRLVL
jgi:putative hydrolase of the HAD superfamily